MLKRKMFDSDNINDVLREVKEWNMKQENIKIVR